MKLNLLKQAISFRDILTGLSVTLGLLPLVAQQLPENVFIKVTVGPVVTEQEGTLGFGWADYNADGYLDLLVANSALDSNPQVRCSLYQNQGDGTFTESFDSPMATKTGSYGDALWGDFDNDGDPDVFLPNPDYQYNDLFRNEGDGIFTDISGEPGMQAPAPDDSFGGSWIDYDNDGWLDLFIVNRGASGDWSTGQNDVLYQSNHGIFEKRSAADVGDLVLDGDPGERCAWTDLDGDGLIDCLRSRVTTGVRTRMFVYRNGGSAGFHKVEYGSLASSEGYKIALADFDNDGDLDIFTSGMYAPYELHRNLNGEVFEEIAAEAGLSSANQAWTQSGCWGDFDNDGDLDLFVVNYQKANTLYLNNGDSTFTSVDAGTPLLDGDRDTDAAWVDIDNDGFLDLFIGSGNGVPQPNYLYRNNLPNEGNANGWLKVRFQGTVSNRSGIGAKVRAQAVIRGQSVRQLRELACAGATAGGQQGLELHFGLGDAAKVDVLRIEWPSGIVQELRDEPVNQILTVTEPPRLIPQGAGSFQIRCWINQSFEVQASMDLVEWSAVETVTNLTGMLVFEDAEAHQHTSRYYRVVTRP
jgi:hypothetical protein